MGSFTECQKRKSTSICYVDTARGTGSRPVCRSTRCVCKSPDFQCLRGFERLYQQDGMPGECKFRPGFGSTTKEERTMQILNRLYIGQSAISSACRLLKLSDEKLEVPSGYELYPGDTCLLNVPEEFSDCISLEKISMLECSRKHQVYSPVTIMCPKLVPENTPEKIPSLKITERVANKVREG